MTINRRRISSLLLPAIDRIVSNPLRKAIETEPIRIRPEADPAGSKSCTALLRDFGH